jgi:NADH-quinone oxidoreductase subunit L
MVWPLRILAVGSAVVGFLGIGTALTLGRDLNRFEHFLHPVAPAVELPHHVSLGIEWLLIALSVAVALGGILLARRFYLGARALEIPNAIATRFPTTFDLVANKYYVDELYDRAVVKPLRSVAWFSWKGIDTVGIDGPINASAWFTEITGDLLRFIQTGNVRNYSLLILGGELAAMAWLLL